jgi:hypothetical protein
MYDAPDAFRDTIVAFSADRLSGDSTATTAPAGPN